MKRIEESDEMQAKKALRRMLFKNKRWAKTNTLIFILSIDNS